eukprot:NODE_1669_length_2406_cov_30.793769.p1 GENE.NODE_1669_length_2406_cov_30.793769~~NODE_1669_length_2406_cov_30.793769.p1  ORF type:complete len:654 (-),score=70.55 NODE_1669_length_2406_cov_30.793769:265-2226(-)
MSRLSLSPPLKCCSPAMLSAVVNSLPGTCESSPEDSFSATLLQLVNERLCRCEERIIETLEHHVSEVVNTISCGLSEVEATVGCARNRVNSPHRTPNGSIAVGNNSSLPPDSNLRMASNGSGCVDARNCTVTRVVPCTEAPARLALRTSVGSADRGSAAQVAIYAKRANSLPTIQSNVEAERHEPMDVYGLATMQMDELFMLYGVDGTDAHRQRANGAWEPIHCMQPQLHAECEFPSGAPPGMRATSGEGNVDTSESTCGLGDGDDSTAHLPKHSCSSRSSVDSIRAFCENALVHKLSMQHREPPFHNIADPWSLHVMTHWLCCVCGIIPFQVGACSAVYQFLPLCVIACMLVYSAVLSAVSPNEAGFVYQCLSSTVYALGGVCGLAHLWLNRIHLLLGPHQRPLEFYAVRCDFIHDWRRISLRHFVKVCAIWMWMVMGRIAMQVGVYDCSLREVLYTVHIYIFGVTCGVVAIIFFCILHIFCGLELAIDKCCVRFFEAKDFGKGVAEWNILQAMLRRAASTIDSCVLTVGTAMLGVLLLSGVEMLNGSVTGPMEAVHCCVSGLPPMVLAHYTCFRAAAITEKCQRVPALVNSWDFGGESFDLMRQYAVRYVTDSAAGFYVKGVRINAFMALKFAYAFGAIVFALLTKTVFTT